MLNREESNSRNETLKIGWNFDNSYAKLSDTFYTKLNPTPVKSPSLIVLNEPLATSLGLNIEELKSEDGIKAFGGNKIPKGACPLAEAYAGHQYGYFTMLGDGRAILIGEQITPNKERFDIQLKGSGETPYSRSGDGRAALGPMLREYIISEAMYALGIPTTRSLAVIKTGESIIREKVLPGAILTRVAASHIRVGTFQYIARWGTLEELKSLTDYTINRHYKETEVDSNRYLSFLKEVIKRQANLIAQWQLVGFVHGVMNTDNMTISGETIDYGPCAFMDTYDPSTVFSSIDTHGRYAYGNQPDIAVWNLTRFAETLIPFIHENQEEAVKLANEAIEGFAKTYHEAWLKGMRGKLGFTIEESEDEALIKELLDIMTTERLDYTNTFRELTIGNMEESALGANQKFIKWYNKWQDRLRKQNETKELVKQLMKSNNPAVIPRNHRVEEALEEAVSKNDNSKMEDLLKVLANPYAYSNEQVEYTRLPEVPNGCYRTFCGT